MNVENRPLVTNEPLEFEKEPVEVQDPGKFSKHLEDSMENTSNQ